MITGTVNAYNEAIVRVLVTSGKLAHEVDAVFDTGFTKYLTLPTALIDALNLEYLSSDEIIQSDGGVTVRIYTGTILWDGQERTVEVQAFEGVPLIGLGLMEDYLLNLPVRAGSVVTLDPLP